MPVMPALHVEDTELATPNANEANDAFAMQNNFPIVLF
jgi:hypothetical protein